MSKYLNVTDQANKLLNLSSYLDRYNVMTMWKARLDFEFSDGGTSVREGGGLGTTGS